MAHRRASQSLIRLLAADGGLLAGAWRGDTLLPASCVGQLVALQRQPAAARGFNTRSSDFTPLQRVKPPTNWGIRCAAARAP